MGLLNTADGYGALTKTLHWLVAALFLLQFALAGMMLSLGPADKALGLTQDNAYNWHKSLGLVALAVAALRVLARKSGRLPNWAPTLSARERAFIHRAEQLLYTAMFVMPLSGFTYVMAGGYGVKLFGVTDLPNPIGQHETLALAAKWVHIVSAYVLLATLAGHIGLVLRHQFILKDGLVLRMLPRRRGNKV